MKGTAPRKRAGGRRRQRTRSAEQTRALGRRLAARLRPGDVVLLQGPLGSGKTTLAQGLAEGLGVRSLVSSPSFVMVNEYDALAGRVLRHLDLYRLPDSNSAAAAEELERAGIAELLYDPQAVTVVEWADKLPARWRRLRRAASGSGRPRALRVRLDYADGPNERWITQDRPV